MMSLGDRKGQSAMELAVFGAILIFILGTIVRQGLGTGYQQNQNLKAMRKAMGNSFLYSEGIIGRGGAEGEWSRNSAFVLILEDRLTSGSTKFAPEERIPFLFSGSGTVTKNLLMPIGHVPQDDIFLPVMDVYINGVHFPLRMAGFKSVCLAEDKSKCGNLRTDPSDLGGYDVWLYDLVPKQVNGVDVNWDPTCGGIGNKGCAILYMSVPNSPQKADSRWCNDLPTAVSGAIPCTNANDKSKNLRADPMTVNYPNGTTVTYIGRFDLNRDGVVNTTDPVYPEPGPGTDSFGSDSYPRRDFSWEWMAVHAYDVTTDPLPKIAKEAGWRGIGYDNEKGIQWNTLVDVDGDFDEEQVVRIGKKQGHYIQTLWVVDTDQGDLDLSQVGKPGAPPVGLLPDMEIYTRNGSDSYDYLRIEEGKLFNSNDQFVRNIQKKDQIDVISRRLQLTHNTMRFCRPNPVAGGAPIRFDKIDENANGSINPNREQEDNPVDYCASTAAECMQLAHIEQTCYALDTNLIFIRSKPIDKRGRKWVTDVTGTSDNYVNFKVPKISDSY